MMEHIQIKGTRDIFYTPSIDFNPETGICVVSGESFLEDAIKFYTPMFAWLEEFCTTEKKPLEFSIKLTYYNTSTSKCLLKMLDIMKEYENRGEEINVFWYFNENEIDEEDIDDFMAESGVAINKVPTS